MSTETASLQHAYAGMVAIGARNGVFAKSGEFSRIIRMLTTPSTDKMEKPAVSDKDLVGLGFEVT